MKKVCLACVLRSEKNQIEGILKKTADIVNEVIIVDLTSSNKSEDFVKSFCKQRKLPLKLYKKKWNPKKHNKNELLKIVKKESFCDYVLLLEENNIIQGTLSFPKDMNMDAYYLTNMNYKKNVYKKMQLLKKDLSWYFEGKIHEYPLSKKNKKTSIIDGKYVINEETFLSTQQMAEIEILRLVSALKDDPDNSLYLYLLGNAYKDFKKNDLAITWLKKCIEKTTNQREKYYANYQLGLVFLEAGDEYQAKTHLLSAWNYDPENIYALYDLFYYYFKNKNYEEAYLTGKLIMDAEITEGYLLLDENKSVYDWRRYDLMSIVCYNLGFIDEAKKYFFKMRNYPESEKQRIKNNSKYFV